MWRRSWTWALMLPLLGACDLGGGPMDPIRPTDPVVGHDDEQDGSLVFDEEKLRARVEGDQLRVELPLSGVNQGPVDGEFAVELQNLDDEVVAEGSSAFSVDEAGDVVATTLPADAVPGESSDEVGYLLHYRLSDGTAASSGYRSLFEALPKTELRARLPDTLQAEQSTRVRVFALDPRTGEARANVDVSLRLEPAEGSETDAEPIELEGRTNDQGTAVLEVPGTAEGTWTARASAGSDGGAIAAAVQDEITVERSHRVLVSTDKPVYQPGQTMHVRALALRRPDLEAEAGSEVTFEIRDGKGNMVFRRFQETNEFGIAGTTFDLASEVNTGDFEVKAIVDGTETARTVEVKRYSLPSFEVDVQLDRSFYLVGETMQVEVRSDYFFGKPVAGGEVTIEAVSLDVDEEAFETVQGQTNDQGLFQAEIPLPDHLVGQPLEGGNALVNLKVSVTDQAGQTEKKQKPVTVSDSAIDVVAVPESGGVVPGVPNDVHLFATDPLNRPVDASFDVTLTEGSAESSPEPTSLGEGMARFTTTPSGALSFEVQAQAPTGESATESFDFAADGSGDGGLLLRTDQALYQVGDTIEGRIFAADGAGGSSGRVFVDVIRGGQTALTKTVELEQGVGEFALDVDQGLTGDVLLEAYRVTPSAAVVRDKKMVFVKDARQLQVDISTDQSSYEPGEEATLEFDVQNQEGEPTMAALAVQMVDEAVYHVTEMKPGLLETWFHVRDALREPSYEVHGVDFDLAGLVTAEPEDQAAQARAQASMAALDHGSAAGEVSSWEGTRQAVRSRLDEHHGTRLQRIEDYFRELEDEGVLDRNNVTKRVENQTAIHDVWGNRYAFEVSERWDGWYATVTSRGPDEEKGTWDDWSGEVQVLSRHRNRFDGAPEERDGGPQPGPPQGGEPGAGGGGPVDEDDGGDEGDGEPRVRKDFPETLLFEPSLITDEEGHAELSVQMADSITEWRVTGLANTKDGALGSTEEGVTVFQDFFIDVEFPATLTRLDEVTFPIAVHNYLDESQTVDIELEAAAWYEATGKTSETLELEPGEVTSVGFPVRVLEAGHHALTVYGHGSEMSDAVQRTVLVEPNGKEHDSSESGVLEGTATHEITYPEGRVPNSHGLKVKVYPGILSQAVEGLDSMLEMPTGCFEQTTASNWPNSLVLKYLRESGQLSPDIEMKATSYLSQGYQRLLTFEVGANASSGGSGGGGGGAFAGEPAAGAPPADPGGPGGGPGGGQGGGSGGKGGGFSLFGDPPGNPILSAMGVMEFTDMAEVMEVDQAVIDRTAEWVAEQQAGDGHWHVDQASEFATVRYDDVRTTAFIAWALAEAGQQPDAVSKALDWLNGQIGSQEADTYTVALAANAFARGAPDDEMTSTLLDQLADRAVMEEDTIRWTYQGDEYNYGGPNVSGVNGTEIEVTALAVQALLASGAHLELVDGALKWLVGNKDALGNWGTTHATILTLRALVASLSNQTESGSGTVTVAVDGQEQAQIDITAENRNVFHTVELDDAVLPDQPNDVSVSYEGTGKLMYQVVSSWWMPQHGGGPGGDGPLSVDVSYDETQLEVSDTVTATATVTNNTQGELNMVMVDVGLPPGFEVLTDQLEQAVANDAIEKYELPGQQVSIYLKKLAPEETKQISFDLRAKYPLEAKSKSSSAYLYYDDTQRDETEPVSFQVD